MLRFRCSDVCLSICFLLFKKIEVLVYMLGLSLRHGRRNGFTYHGGDFSYTDVFWKTEVGWETL